MFFVITLDGNVILGPKPWNRLMFQECLQEECGVSYTLPNDNDAGTPFVVSPTVSVLPVVSMPEPAFNSKIQRLDGPYWNLNAQRAQMSFTVGDLPIDAVRNMLKAVVASNRYSAETGGIKVTVQGQEVTVDTARGSRDIFVDAYNSMGDADTINWKFPEGWMVLTKVELGAIVAAGKQHIQDCFNWEKGKDDEIDAAQTLDALDAIVLVYG